MSKLPMIEVPAIKDRMLAAFVENELAPYEGEELKVAKAAVRTYALNRAHLCTLAEHKVAYARIIREAVATVQPPADEGAGKRTRPKTAPATDTA